MKRVWLIVLALWITPAFAAVVNVKIFDTFGQSYQTVNIGERLGALYNLPFDPTLVIVLGPNLADERLQQQEQILYAIDPEQHGILYAIGTPEETYTRGFSLAPNTAASLMPSSDAFRVLVLGPNGRVLGGSNSVLSREQVLRFAPNQ